MDGVDSEMKEKGRTFCNVDSEMNENRTETVWMVWTVR